MGYLILCRLSNTFRLDSPLGRFTRIHFLPTLHPRYSTSERLDTFDFRSSRIDRRETTFFRNSRYPFRTRRTRRSRIIEELDFTGHRGSRSQIDESGGMVRDGGLGMVEGSEETGKERP